jgi:phospholipase C
MGRTGINWGVEFPRFAVDLTGDGKADVIGFGTDGVWVSLANGQGGFSTPVFVPNDSSGQGQFGYGQEWRTEKHVRTLANLVPPISRIIARESTGETAVPARIEPVNRIGVTSPFLRPAVPDIVGFGDAGVWTAISNRDGSFQTAKFVIADFGYNQGWRIDVHERVLADLNGDGKADFVGFGNDGVWTALGNGDGTFAAARLVLANFGASQGWQTSLHPRFAVDLTGDSHADIIGFGNDGVWTALGNGDGTVAAAKFVIADFGYNQGWRTDVHERVLADLNGDRKADFVGFGNDGVWTALGNGDGTFAPARMVLAGFNATQGWKTSLHPRFAVDLTGNGHADIIGFGDDGVWTALGNGDGTFAAAKYVLADFGVHQGWTVDNHPRFLVDTTGDGRPDIVGFGDAGVWVAKNNGDGTFGEATFVLNDFGHQSGQTAIKHIFVLMMENRSFDHLLGFDPVSGTDTQTGQPTSAAVLAGNESNSDGDLPEPRPSYTVDQSAGDTTVGLHDVLHQFTDVTVQLTGTEYHNLNGGPYPTVNNTGFVTDYAAFSDKTNPGEPMRCFAPKYVPVLHQLASEFVLCDNWHASMAGPTEPNRMFAHAATSGVWDDSPSAFQQLKDETVDSLGIGFSSGTIYDNMRAGNVPFRIYSGDGVPNVVLLKGIGLSDIDLFEDFESDVMDPAYDAAYTFIEPYYGTIDQYLASLKGTFSTAERLALDALMALLREAGLLAPAGPINSQHPPASLYDGETLIKQVYEIIRKSPHWNDSMLILAWDEHGGFYDHVLPPRAAPTGSTGQAHGFVFDQYGPRVPAVVISPLCPKNMIEHRRLEHAALPATVEQMFGLSPMTVRDSSIVGVQNLATLATPRQDTPVTLIDDSQRLRAPEPDPGDNTTPPAIDPSLPLSSINDPWLNSTIFIVAKIHMQSVPAAEAAQIQTRVEGLQTVGDFVQYLNDAIPVVRKQQVVERQLRVARRAAGTQPAPPVAAAPVAAPTTPVAAPTPPAS